MMPARRQPYPTEVDVRTALLTRARAYRRLTSQSFSAIGHKALNDPHFLHNVEQGKGFTLRTYQRVMDYIERETKRHQQEEAS